MNKTRQFCFVRVGGVNYVLRFSSHTSVAKKCVLRLSIQPFSNSLATTSQRVS